MGVLGVSLSSATSEEYQLEHVNLSAAPAMRRDCFQIARDLGLRLPDVTEATKYDGSPVLKWKGMFLAGLALHPSAEPETLVIRIGREDRERLLEEAPETYYLTEHYRRHPVVLVRLSRLDSNALRDLLSVSWKITMLKKKDRISAVDR
jgi:hypothetical protein